MLWCAPMGVVVQDAELLPVVTLLNSRQRRYSLGLLAAPNTQPVRDILPLTLREGKVQTQPGKKPEGDDR